MENTPDGVIVFKNTEDQESFEERAAILEDDANFDRKMAEALAWKEYEQARRLA